MQPLTVSALGPLQLSIALRQRKAQALLVYLLCHAGRALPREHLQLLLWSDSPTEKAQGSLRRALYLLRRALPPHSVIDHDQRIGLAPDLAVDFDVDRLTADLSLYRGEFMQGFSLPNAPVWDEWLAGQREALAGRYAALLDAAARRDLAAGRPAAALAHLQRALAVNPWNEPLHREVISLYLQLGDRAAAQGQYERLRTLLADELGVEPAAETQELAARLAAPADARRDHLQQDDQLVPFFGREAELAQIIAWLTGETRLVTLTGLGGIGKTRLALRAARALQPHFLDGVRFIDLVDTPLNGLPAALAAQGDLLPVGMPADDEALLAALAGRHLLLLLDNFEPLLVGGAAVAYVRRLLAAAPRVRLLVTSRERLNVQAEVVLVLDGLPSDGADAPAVQLFTARARRVEPRFVPDAAAIGTICRAVDGMPLAVELAAAWVRLLDVATIARDIGRQPQLLQGTQRDVPARQASLHAVFQQALARLTGHERQALAALAHCQPGFDAEAAQAIGGCTLFTLLTLVDRSLLQREEGGRFRLQEQLRQFLQAQSSAEEAAAWRDRHAVYYGAWLARHDPAADSGSSDEQATPALLPALANVRAAWRHAAERGLTLVLGQLHAVLFGYLELRGQRQESERLLLLALDRPTRGATSADRRLDARLARRLGLTYRHLGRYGEAQAQLHAAIGWAQAVGDRLLAARAQGELANTLAEAGDLTAAAGAYDDLVATFELLGNARFALTARVSQGMVQRRAGHYAAARTTLLRATEMDALTQDGHLRGVTYNALGAVAVDLGRYAEAGGWYERALPLIEQQGNVPLTATLYVNLATVALQRGDPAQARRCLDQARVLLEPAAAAPEVEGLWQMAHGRLCVQEGDGAAARRAFFAASAALERANQPRFASEAHAWLGRLYAAEGQQTAAEAELERALALAGDHLPTQMAALAELALVRRTADPGSAEAAEWLAAIAAHPATTAETHARLQEAA